MKIRRRKLEVGVPAVAMADIAFNLVLFFIIMARTQDESHLKWDPASAPKVQNSGQARVSVTVDKESTVYLNGRKTSVTTLATDITSLLGTEPAGKRTVLLKIHKETLASTFVPIIEAVSQAGGDVVHVLEERKNED